MQAPVSTPSDNLVPFPAQSTLPWWKRTIDVAGSVCALPLLVPLVVLMLIVTRACAPGPVLFRQERVGLNGRRFTMFKFRTMKAGASAADHQAYALDFIKNNRPMEKLDTRGDSRLIPLGRFLRATGLDELPQVINVLRGEMSLVGPRPCIPYEYEAYLPWQKERFTAMPGLTGLWQVSGKNKLSFEQMIHLDIRYARHLSLREDIRIIAWTIPTLVGQVIEIRRATRSARVQPARPASTEVAALADYRTVALAREARRKLYQFRFHGDAESRPRQGAGRSA
jgi:exopolysaccharide production protein ExoY